MIFQTPAAKTARASMTIALLAIVVAVVLTKMALLQPLYAVAALYVAAFITLAWRRNDIALMLIFASGPFQNDLSEGGGAKFSIAEVNLVLTLPMLYIRCLVQKRRLHVGPYLVPVLLYFGVCAFSSAIHWHGTDSLISLVQMFLYLVVVVCVFCTFADDPRQYWLAFKAMVGIGAFLAVAGLATNYWFIGLNKNGIAASLSCSFVINVALLLSPLPTLQKRVLSLTLLVISVGLLFSLSRGAWMGSIGAVAFMFLLRGELARLLRIVLLLLPLLALFWFTLPQHSRDYAGGFDQEHYNIKLRFDSIDIAKNYFFQSPVYGMGVGLRKTYDATNLFLMTLAETGVLGLGTFLLLNLVFFRMVWWSRRYIPPADPLSTLLAIGGALVLEHTIHGMVDHYWGRGALMIAWASAGMAARAYYIAVDRARTQALPLRAAGMRIESL